MVGRKKKRLNAIHSLIQDMRKWTEQLRNGLIKEINRIRYGKNIYLVYTMGKVGTSTVSELFKKKHPELLSFHLHYLSDYWINEKLPSLNSYYHGQIKYAKKALDIISKSPRCRIKVITMVREPIAREISIIFQNWKGIFGVNSVNDLSEEQLSCYLDDNSYENALTWFDTEFKAFLKFDIYSMPFEKERGYCIYHTEKTDILCMKTEKMNDCIKQAFAEFAGMRIVVPSSANRSEDKEGSELYSFLAKEYKAPIKKLSLLYNSKYVRHFYSDNEIDGFVRKWSRCEIKYMDIASILTLK